MTTDPQERGSARARTMLMVSLFGVLGGAAALLAQGLKITGIRENPPGQIEIEYQADTTNRFRLLRGPTITNITTPIATNDIPASSGRFSLPTQPLSGAPGGTDPGSGLFFRVEQLAAPRTNVAPVVRLTSPAGGAVLLAPANVPFTTSTADSDGMVKRVEFFSGTNKLGEAVTPPFVFAWESVPAGTYSLTARATDDQGAVGLSPAVSVTVAAPDAFPPTTLTSSPANGEGEVSVNRETILRFSNPLAVDTVIRNDAFFASYGGRKLLSRIELSSDKRTATLFYLETVPASARIRVTFVGDSVSDLAGRPVDADGDGRPGGMAEIDYDTLSITPEGQTAIIGRVFASELVPDPKGTGATVNKPLAGVTITVDGAEETLRAVTDSLGNFKLQPCPAGKFFVHIDGRTSPLSRYPAGDYYPVVGKQWEAVAGRTDNLAGGTGEIYLPIITQGTLQPVSATTETTITFPPSVVASNAALAGVSITVPPNALFSDNGTRGGRVGIAPVSPDRLPGPLPNGLNLPIVITVQTDGGLNFDTPAAVRFPNLPDPETGQLPSPGSAAKLWSFNHDKGDWEAVGDMIVSGDGRFIETLPGSGVVQPGWHGACPCDTCRLCSSVQGGGAGPNCTDAYFAAIGAAADLSLFGAASAIPGVGCAENIGLFALSATANCVLDQSGCAKTLGLGILGTSVGCLPVPGSGVLGIAIQGANAALKYGPAIAAAHDFLTCQTGSAPPTINGIPQTVFDEQLALVVPAKQLTDRILGSPVWTSVHTTADAQLLYNVFQKISSYTSPNSDGGTSITASECEKISSMPLPSGITREEAAALCRRFTRMIDGTLPPSELDVEGIRAAAEQLVNVARELQRRGWVSSVEAFVRGKEFVTGIAEEAVARGEIVQKPLPFQIGGIRGVLGSDGRLGCLPIPPGKYTLSVFYPGSRAGDRLGGVASSEVFVSGTCVRIGPGVLRPVTSTDTDADGLPDEVEEILGTNAFVGDTDNDGIPDGAELDNGTNPLDGLAVATGIIASADTPGTAVDICAINNMAIVADSEAGIAVFNVMAGLNPVRVAQVDTPGTALAVACSGNLIAVADGAEGLQIVDIADPPAARIVRQIGIEALGGGSAHAVASAANLAFVGTTQGSVSMVDLQTGILFQRIDLGGRVEDLAIEGTTLYAYANGRLQVLPFGNEPMEKAGVVEVPAPSGINSANGRGRLFVGNNVAYAVHTKGYDTFDVSNAASPRLIAAGNTSQFGWKQIVLNGSGTALAAMSPNQAFDGPHHVALFDTSDPARTDAFLTQFETPGIARSVAIYNGLGYVADHVHGLQVINYLAYDNKKTPPKIQLTSNLSGGQAEEGSLVRLTARVSDDVQVRNVEFYVDGQLAVNDGNFPFEHSLFAPLMANGRTNFTVQARAYDTGGNAAWSETLTNSLAHDLTPPRVRRTTPAANTLLASAQTVVAYLSEPMNEATLNAASFRVQTPGPDNRFGTGDDGVVAGGTLTYQDETRSVIWTAPQALPFGGYEVVIQSPFADRAGLTFASPHRSRFWVLSAGPAEDDDGDGLTNLDEVRRGLNPLNADTDNDGSSDGAEIAEGTDPLNFKSRPDRIVFSTPHLEVALPDANGIQGNGPTVSAPEVEAVSAGAGPVASGVFIGAPLVDISWPGTSPGEAGVIVATPPVEVSLPSEHGASEIGLVLGTPGVELFLPDQTPSGGPGTRVDVGMSVELILPDFEGRGGPLPYVADPPVELDFEDVSPFFEGPFSFKVPQPPTEADPNR